MAPKRKHPSASKIVVKPVTKEFTFVPVAISDLTVHYGTACYHMHQLYLITISSYFRAVLGQDTEFEQCDLTDRCQRPGHRCITIDTDDANQIGGRAITHAQLNSFFREMYSHADASGEWKKILNADRPSDSAPPMYYIRIIRSIDVAKDEVTWDCHEHDGVSELVTVGEADPSSQSTVPGQRIIGHRDVGFGLSIASDCQTDYPQYHLANYFGCDVMMQHYRTHAAALVKTVAERTHFSGVPWKILTLADQYHWPEVREACIDICKRELSFSSRLASPGGCPQSQNPSGCYDSHVQDAEMMSVCVIKS